MKCRSVQKNLSAYADRELRRRLRRQVEKHLALCEKCAAELLCLEKVDQAAKTSLRRVVSDKAPPRDLRERVMRAAQAVRARRPILLPVGKLAAAAVIIAFASGLIVGLVQEVRFRSERESLRQTIAEQRGEITIAKRDSGTAREQLIEAQARLAKMEAQLALASALRDDSKRLAEGAPGPRRRPWPPVICLLQMSDAESLLKNGLFR